MVCMACCIFETHSTSCLGAKDQTSEQAERGELQHGLGALGQVVISRPSDRFELRFSVPIWSQESISISSMRWVTTSKQLATARPELDFFHVCTVSISWRGFGLVTNAEPILNILGQDPATKTQILPKNQIRSFSLGSWLLGLHSFEAFRNF